jgi:hypothetical protein
MGKCVASLALHGYLETRLDSISSTTVNLAASLTAGSRGGRYGTVATSPRLGPVQEVGIWTPEIIKPLSWHSQGSTIGFFGSYVVKAGLQGRFIEWDRYLPGETYRSSCPNLPEAPKAK